MAMYDSTTTNQYDLQKQKVRDEEQQRRKLEQDALQRRLASRGFTAGSGYTESQQRKSDIENLAGERTRLRDIDISQLAAGEQAAEAEKNRQWQTGERIGSQGFQTQERLGTQDFTAGERKATQKFQTGERVGSEEASSRQQTSERLGKQQYEATEAEKQRQYEGGFKQQEINQAATEFASKLDFDYWAQQSGYSENEANRAWQERQGTLERNAAATEAEAQRAFNWDMTNLQNQLSQSNMTLEQAIANDTASLKNRTDLMFALGTNGTNVDTSNLSQVEKDAYELGKAGKAKQEYDMWLEGEKTKRDQSIVTLAENPGLAADVQNIVNTYLNAIGIPYSRAVYQEENK